MAQQAIVKVPDQTHDVIKVRMPIAQGAVKAIDAFEIKTDEDSEFAAKMLREVKDQYEAVETERKKITTPIRAAEKAVNDFFRPVTSLLLAAESNIKGKIAAYVREKQEANMRALGMAATDKKAFEQLELVSAHAPAGVSTREVWKFEIVDAGAVPREYCSPDTTKIREYAKLLEDGASTEPGGVVAGVRFYRDATVTSRRTK